MTALHRSKGHFACSQEVYPKYSDQMRATNCSHVAKLCGFGYYLFSTIIVLHIIVTDQHHMQMNIRCLFKKDMVPLSSQVSMKMKPKFLPTKKTQLLDVSSYAYESKIVRPSYSCATLLFGFGFYQFGHDLSIRASLCIPLLSSHLVLKICTITVFTNL